MSVPADPGVRPRIRFDRHEWAGAFGDMGTDIPLLVGMVLAANLDGGSVLVAFGLMQILTGVAYRMPMPVQPLKAMAAIVIAGGIAGPVLYGGGLAIGVLMLLLTLTGTLGWLGRLVPKVVIRGIQFGLGLQLASIALQRYVRADGAPGYAMAAAASVLVVLLFANRRLPAALPVVAMGLVISAIRIGPGGLGEGLGFHAPAGHLPRPSDITTGLLVLAIPQLPLSLGNSILATRQLAADLFPERPVTLRRIGLTYAAMNLINPFLGGVPTCHGAGGMAGHHAFGGRTGGSVVLYGIMFAALGLAFGNDVDRLVGAYPLPILGVLLLFESLALITLVRDTAESRRDLAIAVLVGLVAAGLPYGYVVALVLGTAVARLGPRATLVPE